MKRTSLGHMNCSVAQTLDVVGDPWTLLIVRDALFGVTRFDDFRRSLDIPRATLASRLDTLVQHGVMERRLYRDRPERHEYVLTEKGRDLRRVMVSMLQWGDEWSGLATPPVTLIDATTGDEIDAVYVDRRSGTPLSELKIRHRFNT